MQRQRLLQCGVFSAPGPSEFLSTIAARNASKISQRNLDICQQNLDLLREFFMEHDSIFEWFEPIAGTMAFPRFRRGVGIDTQQFCVELVQREGVLILPGLYYCLKGPYQHHFRIGFGRRNFAECLNAFREAIPRVLSAMKEA